MSSRAPPAVFGLPDISFVPLTNSITSVASRLEMWLPVSAGIACCLMGVYNIIRVGSPVGVLVAGVAT